MQYHLLKPLDSCHRAFVNQKSFVHVVGRQTVIDSLRTRFQLILPINSRKSNFLGKTLRARKFSMGNFFVAATHGIRAVLPPALMVFFIFGPIALKR